MPVSTVLAGQPAPPLYFARMKSCNRDGVPPMNLEAAPAILSADDAAELDLDRITVIDVRPWQQYRTRHARRALWSAPGAWFPASVGSFVDRDQPVVLLIDGNVAEQYVRLLYRIGIDHIEGVMTPEVFEAAAGRMETEASEEIDAHGLQKEVEAGNTRIVDVRNPDEVDLGCISGSESVPLPELLARLDELEPDFCCAEQYACQ